MLELDTVQMAFLLLPTLHHWFLRHVRSGMPLIVKLQKMHSSPLDSLCSMCATLGNEFCFLVLLPFIAWNLDMAIGRKMTLLWGIGFYTSNYLKDLLLLPRPYELSEDVMNLLPGTHGSSRRSSPRHGLPCTRAFSATALPFYLLFTTHELYGYSFTWGLGLAVAWCFLVSLSRVYLGLHSPTDVLAGVILGALFVLLWLGVGDRVDHYLTTGYWWLPLAEPLIAWLLLLAYPAPQNCAPAFTETAVVGGFATGCAMGSVWYLQTLLRLKPSHASASKLMGPAAAALCLTSECVGLMGLRALLGLSLLAATHLFAIRFFLTLLPRLDVFKPHEAVTRARAKRASMYHHTNASQSASASAVQSFASSPLYTSLFEAAKGAFSRAGGGGSGGSGTGNGEQKRHQHGMSGKKGASHNGLNGTSSSLPPSLSSSGSLGSSPVSKHQGSGAGVAPMLLALWSVGLLSECSTGTGLLVRKKGGSGANAAAAMGEEALLTQWGGADVLVPVLYCASLCVGFNSAFTVPLLLRLLGLLGSTTAATITTMA